MSYLSISLVVRNTLGFACAVTLGTSAASAAPTAEVAKRCIHYAYVAYPFKRPGAVPMSGDRQAYIRDCMAKNGDVPAPTSPKP
jgi:hypothetical protein